MIPNERAADDGRREATSDAVYVRVVFFHREELDHQFSICVISSNNVLRSNASSSPTAFGGIWVLFAIRKPRLTFGADFLVVVKSISFFGAMVVVFYVMCGDEDIFV
jgi:hypothetical protein